MRDPILDEGFLRSSVNLPGKIREKIVSQLQAFVEDPRDRDLDIERMEGSKELLSLGVDTGHRIILRREKAATTLLFVATEDTPYRGDLRPGTPVHKMLPADIVIAPLEALETLLVEEKYLPLTRHLLELDLQAREAQFAFREVEKILNAHLPPEARRFPTWWANQKGGKRPQAFAWIAAGWLVSKVDVKAAVVKFRRK